MRRTFTSAPLCSSRRTTSSSPTAAAQCSGVAPYSTSRAVTCRTFGHTCEQAKLPGPAACLDVLQCASTAQRCEEGSAWSSAERTAASDETNSEDVPPLTSAATSAASSVYMSGATTLRWPLNTASMIGGFRNVAGAAHTHPHLVTFGSRLGSGLGRQGMQAACTSTEL